MFVVFCSKVAVRSQPHLAKYIMIFEMYPDLTNFDH